MFGTQPVCGGVPRYASPASAKVQPSSSWSSCRSLTSLLTTINREGQALEIKCERCLLWIIMVLLKALGHNRQDVEELTAGLRITPGSARQGLVLEEQGRPDEGCWSRPVCLLVRYTCARPTLHADITASRCPHPNIEYRCIASRYSSHIHTNYISSPTPVNHQIIMATVGT